MSTLSPARAMSALLRPVACVSGIDIHAHVVPERFPAYLGRAVPSPWPMTTDAPDALMRGTDCPFNFHEPRPLARLDEAGLDSATQEALAYGNARRFLGRRAAVNAEETV